MYLKNNNVARSLITIALIVGCSVDAVAIQVAADCACCDAGSRSCCCCPNQAGQNSRNCCHSSKRPAATDETSKPHSCCCHSSSVCENDRSGVKASETSIRRCGIRSCSCGCHHKNVPPTVPVTSTVEHLRQILAAIDSVPSIGMPLPCVVTRGFTRQVGLSHAGGVPDLLLLSCVCLT